VDSPEALEIGLFAAFSAAELCKTYGSEWEKMRPEMALSRRTEAESMLHNLICFNTIQAKKNPAV
jgi:hypothetical protein